ncbi:MAG: peptidoglycan-binding protein [Candidatus Pacebacteria bacterium]|nr:peptidoglycan-binding protein [Candidatus Paceibacterota bacterium]
MQIAKLSRYFLSALLVAVFLASTPFMVSRVHASTTSLSLSDLVELFIALDIISADKAPLARKAVAGAVAPPTVAPVPPTVAPVPPTTPPVVCMPTTGPVLGLGSRGSEVTLLQQYLAQDATLYPEREVSGYYGPATERAVQRFQAKYGIVTAGTPATTGYGTVGAKTRAVMVAQCRLLRVSVDLKIDGVDGPQLNKKPGYARFTWSSKNADYCVASNDSGDPTQWAGAKSVQGEEQVAIGNEKGGVMTYKIICGASSGKVSSASDSILVRFNYETTVAPVITTVSPDTVPLDGVTAVTLRGSGFAQNAYVALEGASISKIEPLTVSADGKVLKFMLPVGESYKDSIGVYVVNLGSPNIESNKVYVRVAGVTPEDEDLLRMMSYPVSIQTGKSVTYTIIAKDRKVKKIGMTLNCSGVTEVRAKGGHDCGETIVNTPTAYPYEWTEWYTAPDGGSVTMEISPLDANGNKFYPVRHTVTTNITGPLGYPATRMVRAYADPLNIFSYPSNSSGVLVATRPSGTLGKLNSGPEIDGSTSWWNVWFLDGLVGWVREKNLQMAYPDATLAINQSALQSIPDTSFTISGTNTAGSGEITVAIVGRNYSGSMDWGTISDALKGGSGYKAVSNTTSLLGQKWSVPFGGLAEEGNYTVMVYDANHTLIMSEILYIGYKG